METVDMDTYGRHAERPDRPAGLDGVVYGRPVRYPWAWLIEPAHLTGRRRANWERPAGVYFERNGLVHYTGHLDRYYSVLSCLRHGEKPLPRLRSAAKELTSRS